nr:hypothetical protein [Tanacetum cinerariifolium]
MDSLSPQVVFAAKLSILNPNEFDLWKMRIEQYFLMTDYSLWEVTLNGDSPAPTRVVDGVLQLVAPTTAKHRAIWRTLFKKILFLHTRITFSVSMDSLSLQVVFAAKLSILNPNEFDLWKMRIEQYFLMTDYSLWEVTLNGDSPAPTRVVDGVLQLVAPTTAKH